MHQNPAHVRILEEWMKSYRPEELFDASGRLSPELAEELELFDNHGRAPQERHLGRPVFYGVTETGELNTYVHIWAYDDAADREQRRAAMQADPARQAFLKLSAEAGNLLRQENRIMTPAPFFQLRR
jgi:phosphoketolase